MIPAADASAARTEASAADLARPRRISVHLTGFAPGCDRIGSHDRRRWKTFYGQTPGPIARALLKRLARAPAEVGAHQEINGDLCLTGQAPPELAGFLSTEPGEPVVLAMAWEGLTLAEWTACRAALIAAGWRPDPAAIPS